ncbi:hypothetical protein LCGC14_1525330 [marine sediment metagenome]|uniref:Uncharacterized protein n=1 Tax=marine sediment metagenome TaxID=412755 RepID=A0A0F9LCW9_9ZZZZ
MTRSTAAAIFLSFAIAAGPAYADPEIVEPEVVPLFEGETAGFDGFLVPELRLDEYTLAETNVKDLRLKLASEKERCRKKLEVYVAKLEEATAPPDWHETPSFNRWLGFGIGVLATGAAIAATSALTK